MKKIPLMALALLPLGAFAAVESFSDVPDLKPEVMRVYGLRSAISLNDNTIKGIFFISFLRTNYFERTPKTRIVFAMLLTVGSFIAIAQWLSMKA